TPIHTLFPYTTLFRSEAFDGQPYAEGELPRGDRKSQRCGGTRDLVPQTEHRGGGRGEDQRRTYQADGRDDARDQAGPVHHVAERSEEHTSELQSLAYL